VCDPINNVRCSFRLSGISHETRKIPNPKPQSLCDPINTAALDPSFGFDTASAEVWERFTLAMHVAAASGLETGVGSWYTGVPRS